MQKNMVSILQEMQSGMTFADIGLLKVGMRVLHILI
jgi:hypothetical protein